MLESFFIYGDLPSNLEKGDYQFPLVILSYMVAAFASYTALVLAQQLMKTEGNIQQRLLHAGGAFAMGAGIWSMHFIGMLSYKMDMKIEYDPGLTLLSMLIAIAFAYGVLYIVGRERLTVTQILVGGVLAGIGICSMHYTGMAAMEMDADLHYTPGYFFLSVAIAIAASAAALWTAFTLARHSGRFRYLFTIGAGLIMGAAICGMHYTGMKASVFIPWADCRYDPDQDFDMLAVSIAVITTIILAMALAVGAYRKAQTEFRLQASESRLRAIMDNVHDGLVTTDARGVVESFNPACERIFGYNAAEVVGGNVNVLIPDGYIARYLIDDEPPLSDATSREVSGRRKDGTTFPMDLSVSVFTLEGKRYLTGIIRDITARKEAETKLLHYTQELEESNRNLDDFVYIASHDLKEPVRGISNYARFLLEDYWDKLDDEGKDQLQSLENMAKRMIELIDDLLRYSRVGREGLSIAETDLNEVINDTLELMEPLIKSANATVTVNGYLPVVACNKTLVGEVFRNLITNAIKYNDCPDKKVEIGSTTEHDRYPGKTVFFVRDNGIGIPEAYRDAVFKMFKRLHGRDRYGGGTGSGLAIVKKIVDRHSGEIWIEANEGNGSIFFFTLAAE